MSIYLIFGVCAVVFFAAIAVFGATGGFNSPLRPDQPHDAARGLPADWTADDIADLRFQVAARGYREDAVDAVLDQLTARLREREDELARLRERDTGSPRLAGHDAGSPRLAGHDAGSPRLAGHDAAAGNVRSEGNHRLGDGVSQH